MLSLSTTIESTAQYGNQLVTLKSEEDKDKFIIRKFEITEEVVCSQYSKGRQVLK
jgi:hypothetical protein